MPRYKEAKKTELYGSYEEFNEKQVEYLKFLTNPENKLHKFTDDEVSEILGIARQTLYNYRQDEEFREAIKKETFLKSVDDLPDQWTDLTNMSLARGKYKEIAARNQLQAKKLWWQVTGFVDEARDKTKKLKKEVHSSLEQRLIEYDRKYDRQNNRENAK